MSLVTTVFGEDLLLALVGGYGESLKDGFKDVEVVNLNEEYYECDTSHDFPHVRLDPVGGLINSTLTVCGGIERFHVSHSIKKECYHLNTVDGERWYWREVEPMTIGKYAAAEVVTPDGRMYLSISLNYT